MRFAVGGSAIDVHVTEREGLPDPVVWLKEI
jgi:hypothetical protein